MAEVQLQGSHVLGSGGGCEDGGKASSIKSVLRMAKPGTGAIRRAIQSADFVIPGREFTRLIRDCRNTKQWEKALEILEAVRLGGPTVGELPSFYTFSATISVCSKSGRVAEALWLLGEMKAAAAKDASIKPDASVYRLVILCCARQNEPAIAVRLLREMSEEGAMPSEDVLQQLLKALVGGVAGKKAVEVLDELHGLGVALPVGCYNSVLKTAANEGDMNTTTEVFLMMQMAGVDPDASSCDHMMHAIATASHPVRGLQLLQDMKESGIHLHASTYAQLLKSCMDDGHSELLPQVFQTMEDSPASSPDQDSSSGKGHTCNAT